MSSLTALHWGLIGALLLITTVSVALWILFFPKYKQYTKRVRSLAQIDSEYRRLAKSREDVIFHFYWAVDRGDMADADKQESIVMNIDAQLETLRNTYNK